MTLRIAPLILLLVACRDRDPRDSAAPVDTGVTDTAVVDTADPDTATDTDTAEDTDVATDVPSLLDVTSGGGTLTGATHQGWITVGTPIAEHELESPNYALTLGIGAVVAK